MPLRMATCSQPLWKGWGEGMECLIQRQSGRAETHQEGEEGTSTRASTPGEEECSRGL